jgi:PAS domain S-box-containing protein
VLTEAAQVLNLSPTEADRRYPVNLKAVVTCFDARAELLFVQDDTAGIYVWAYRPTFSVKPGEVVRIHGTTAAGGYSPIVSLAELERTGESKRLRVKNASLEDMAAGREDAQLVAVEAIVRDETLDWSHLVLDLTMGQTSLKARVLSFPARREANLVGVRVWVHGVMAVHLNNNRQLTGFHLIVPDYSFITPLTPPTVDPFAPPVTHIRDLMTYSSRGQFGQRVHVQGLVTLCWPGKAVCVRDATGALLIRPRHSTPLYVGQKVDVAGFPAAGGYSPVLEDGVFRSAGPGVLPPPKLVSAERLLAGTEDNDLIQIEGDLEEPERLGVGDERVLVLRATNRTFRAVWSGPAGGLNELNLAAGCRLRLTGICSVAVDEDHRPASFEVWLRAPTDIEVLRRPAWWTAERLAWFSVGMAGLVVVGFIWLELWRRHVARRAEAIQQREGALEGRYRDLFENANDIIFTCDSAGRLTSLNKAGELIFGYNRQEAEGLDFFQLVTAEQCDLVRSQFQRRLGGEPHGAAELELIARDGRRICLELNTRLDYQEGRLVGLRGIARDITGRKEAEAALRQSESELRESLEARERLGRDLHDGIIQSIYAVGLGLEDCRRWVGQRPQEAEGALARASLQLNAVIRDVRNFILGLEPEALKGREFRAALDSVIQAFGPESKVRFQLDVDAEAAASLDVRQTMQALQIAREAISNSLRHAGASTTVISLHQENGCIRLEVRDDGRGFDMKSPNSTGHGLRNIAARARDLNARIEIVSRPGEGAAVILDIPCSPLDPRA